MTCNWCDEPVDAFDGGDDWRRHLEEHHPDTRQQLFGWRPWAWLERRYGFVPRTPPAD